MKNMRALTATVVSAIVLAPMPAFAADGEDGGLSVLETVGLFVLLPVSIYGVIWLLWSIPKWRREASAPATGDNWNPSPSK